MSDQLRPKLFSSTAEVIEQAHLEGDYTETEARQIKELWESIRCLQKSNTQEWRKKLEDGFGTHFGPRGKKMFDILQRRLAAARKQQELFQMQRAQRDSAQQPLHQLDHAPINLTVSAPQKDMSLVLKINSSSTSKRPAIENHGLDGSSSALFSSSSSTKLSAVLTTGGPANIDSGIINQVEQSTSAKKPRKQRVTKAEKLAMKNSPAQAIRDGEESALATANTMGSEGVCVLCDSVHPIGVCPRGESDAMTNKQQKTKQKQKQSTSPNGKSSGNYDGVASAAIVPASSNEKADEAAALTDSKDGDCSEVVKKKRRRSSKGKKMPTGCNADDGDSADASRSGPASSSGDQWQASPWSGGQGQDDNQPSLKKKRASKGQGRGRGRRLSSAHGDGGDGASEPPAASYGDGGGANIIAYEDSGDQAAGAAAGGTDGGVSGQYRVGEGARRGGRGSRGGRGGRSVRGGRRSKHGGEGQRDSPWGEQQQGQPGQQMAAIRQADGPNALPGLGDDLVAPPEAETELYHFAEVLAGAGESEADQDEAARRELRESLVALGLSAATAVGANEDEAAPSDADNAAGGGAAGGSGGTRGSIRSDETTSVATAADVICSLEAVGGRRVGRGGGTALSRAGASQHLECLSKNVLDLHSIIRLGAKALGKPAASARLAKTQQTVSVRLAGPAVAPDLTVQGGGSSSQPKIRPRPQSSTYTTLRGPSAVGMDDVVVDPRDALASLKLSQGACVALSRGIQLQLLNLVQDGATHSRRRNQQAALSTYRKLHHQLASTGSGKVFLECSRNVGMKFGPDVRGALRDEEEAARIEFETAKMAADDAAVAGVAASSSSSSSSSASVEEDADCAADGEWWGSNSERWEKISDEWLRKQRRRTDVGQEREGRRDNPTRLEDSDLSQFAAVQHASATSSAHGAATNNATAMDVSHVSHVSHIDCEVAASAHTRPPNRPLPAWASTCPLLDAASSSIPARVAQLREAADTISKADMAVALTRGPHGGGAISGAVKNAQRIAKLN